jgi:hypothetical protein
VAVCERTRVTAAGPFKAARLKSLSSVETARATGRRSLWYVQRATGRVVRYSENLAVAERTAATPMMDRSSRFVPSRSDLAGRWRQVASVRS